jgi:starch-binding outer membrane protein, SusD/RagB family
MKFYNIINMAIASILMVGMTSCEDFLNRPTEDSYTIDGFYQTDAQCFQSVNPIYNSPWYDFQRGFIKIGDVLSGNIYYSTDNAYQSFVLKSSDTDLKNASASLWSVNAYCNSILENIDMKAGPDVSETTKNTVKGEALTWKAMSYFFLVRCFGAVPIIHNNSEIISSNTSNSLYRNKIEDVYTYIVKTLEKAIELLPATNEAGRIDKYCAYGLLAKVYLTKSGYGRSATGDRNTDDLAKAAEYAKKVIDESGRTLMPVYSDIFRLKNNISPESLIAWRWTVGTHWTCQNTEQSDLAMQGWSEFGDCWGSWVSPTIDLQNMFNEDARNKTSRVNTDDRRKATMMMMTDHYDYFWADRGGFTFDWDGTKHTASNGAEYQLTYGAPTGANCVKHLVGDNQDHIDGCGVDMLRMQTSLATHLLRLADVYLIYAEAVLGNNSSTSDAGALKAFNAVRARSIKNYTPVTSITFNDVFNERRMELACEGDFWYDFVRLSYYKPDEAKARLAAQERGSWNNLDSYYKGTIDNSTVTLSSWKVASSNIFFQIPFPDTDQAANPNLSKDPVPFDFSSIGY